MPSLSGAFSNSSRLLAARGARRSVEGEQSTGAPNQASAGADKEAPSEQKHAEHWGASSPLFTCATGHSLRCSSVSPSEVYMLLLQASGVSFGLRPQEPGR